MIPTSCDERTTEMPTLFVIDQQFGIGNRWELEG